VTLTGPRVDLLLGGAWTDVTSFVLTDEKIQIRRGRSSETGSAENSSATLSFNNADFRFSPRYPSGPYFGQFNRNTPIRIGIGTPPAGTSAPWVASGALQAPAVNAEASGTVLSFWAQNDNAAAITGPAGYTMQGTFTGLSVAGLATNAGYKTGISAGTVAAVTATSTKTAAGAALSLFIPGATAAASSQHGLRQYSAANAPNGSASTSNWITDTVTAGDVCIVFTAWSADPRNAMLQAPMDTSTRADWILVADSGPSSGARVQAWARYCPAAGTISFYPAGEVYAQSDRSFSYYRFNATPYQPRFAGFCSEIAPASSSFGKDLRTAVTCGSALRVYTQGTPAARSAAHRYLSDRSPSAYWPLESGTASANYAASPIQGVASMTLVGASAGADSTSFAASSALPTLPATGYTYGFPAFPATAASQSGSACALVNVTAAGASGGYVYSLNMANDGTSATISAIGVQWASTGFQLYWTDGTGATVTEALTNPGSHGATMVGVPCAISLYWKPHALGPTLFDVHWRISPADGSNESFGDFAANTGTNGRVTKFTAGPLGGSGVMTVGHMAYSTDGTTADPVSKGLFPNVFAQAGLVQSWSGEDVVLRMLRLAQEDSVPLSLPLVSDAIPGVRSDNVWQGPQPIATGPDLFTLAQATDGGELAEARGFAGLLYRPLSALCSQASAQTFDYSTPGYIGDPFEPTDDDTLIRNDCTATQQGGSSARAYLATGALSVMPPPAGVGQYVTSVTVSTDEQGRDLPNIAAWALALGTIDAERFKAVTSVLEAIPASAAALMAVEIGQHVQTTNTPAWVQPGPADHLVIGTAEVIGAVNEQSITYVLRPFGPFAVFRLDDSTFGKLDSGNRPGLNGGM
jgi:hypothetical protein